MTLGNRIALSTLAVSFGLTGWGSPVLAADDVFCQRYARDIAFTIPADSPSLSKECRNDTRWTVGKLPVDPRLDLANNADYQWCLTASEQEVNEKRYAHNAAVNACNNEYLTITLNSGSITTPPASDTSRSSMVEVPPESVLDILKAKSTKKPFASMFYKTNLALQQGKMDSCVFRSLNTEIDDNADTTEWVVSTDQQCLKGNINTLPHVWIMQRQANDQYRVLLEADDNVIRLRNSSHSGYKDISITTTLDPESSRSGVCGAIYATWQFQQDRYLPVDGDPIIDDACIGYNLPDYLVGAQTASASPEEWEKAMQDEEKRRKQLAGPAEEKLKAYIPSWIRSVKLQTGPGVFNFIDNSARPRPSIRSTPAPAADDDTILGVDIEIIEDILNNN